MRLVLIANCLHLESVRMLRAGLLGLFQETLT